MSRVFYKMIGWLECMKRRRRMEEKTKKSVRFDLRRREFLKMGLAAGLVAGIPMGIIPKMGSRRAYAEVTEMAEALEKIPPATRWTIATKGLTGLVIVTAKTLLDILGQEKYNEIWGQIWAEAGKGSKQVADALGLAGDGAKSVQETSWLVTAVAMGPEVKARVVEATAEKVVVRNSECPYWNRMKEFGISDDICSVADSAYFNGLAQSLNPKVTVALTKAMPLGDPYCEWIYKLQR